MQKRVVTVKNVLSSRYESEVRPDSWDERTAGIDRILADDGQEYSLYSSGQQSTPKPGWGILLQDMKDNAYVWTLYSMN